MTATSRPVPPVVVIDSIMGAGKTTYIIDHMNRAYEQALSDMLTGRSEAQPPKFLYVTPLLDEVDRVKLACPSLDFRDPAPIHGRKYFGLDKLIDEGANIATTHALFGFLTKETMGKLKEQGYTLVIDEVLTCVDYFSGLKKADVQTLFGGGHVYVEEATSLLRWNHEQWPEPPSRYKDIPGLCDNGNLIAWSLDGEGFVPGKRGSLLLWAFPVDFLAAFKNVYLLTYLFHGSPMRAYLEAEGVSFDMRTVADKGRRLVPWSAAAEREAKDRIRKHLKVYDGPLNAVAAKAPGSRANPLSKGWFAGTGKGAPSLRLRTATTNYFRWFSRNGFDSRLFAWTTFKAQRKALAGKGYKHHTQWIPLNAKATNDYRHKTVLAYLANRFSIPEIRGYFESRGVDVYEDLYALSELVQWLWRSAIRDDREPRDVHVYIPSDRMRDLLNLWLSCDDALSFIKAVTGNDLSLPRAA
jgi:hypothetical protein